MKKKLIAGVALLFMAIGLSSCSEEKSGTDMSHETTAKISNDSSKVLTEAPNLKKLTSQHKVTVNGASFNLDATYGIPRSRLDNWYFTQPTSVSIGSKTSDLPANLDVHVTEIYSDVTMISKYARYNGVRQDSADLKYSELPDGGVAIDNSNNFSVPFQVEGINENETSFYVINGYGSSDTDRISEGDLREYAQGGALKTVWTLLVHDKKTDKTYAKTVQDSIGLPYVTKSKED